MIKKNLKYIVYLFFIVFVLLEISLRMMDQSDSIPYQENSSLNCDYAQYDSILGYTNKPGQSNCFLFNPNDRTDSLPFNVNHLPDGSRNTRSYDELNQDKSSIHFYGCSVIWGYGISDSSTIPYKIQTKIAQSNSVKNFGVGGYGTLQAYLRLKKNLENYTPPDIVVLGYASFQDYRNTKGNYVNDMLTHLTASSSESERKKCRLPIASLKNDELKIEYIDYKNIHSKSIFNKSAVYKKINQLRQSTKEVSRSDKIAISKKIIQSIVNLCDTNGIDFILCGIYPDEETSEVLTYFTDRDIKTVDLSIDYNDPKMNLLPYDAHLSDYANSIMAEHFYTYYELNYKESDVYLE